MIAALAPISAGKLVKSRLIVQSSSSFCQTHRVQGGEIQDRLSRLATAKGREMHLRHGARPRVLGVKMGDIRAIANELKHQPLLAREL